MFLLWGERSNSSLSKLGLTRQLVLRNRVKHKWRRATLKSRSQRGPAATVAAALSLSLGRHNPTVSWEHLRSRSSSPTQADLPRTTALASILAAALRQAKSHSWVTDPRKQIIHVCHFTFWSTQYFWQQQITRAPCVASRTVFYVA